MIDSFCTTKINGILIFVLFVVLLRSLFLSILSTEISSVQYTIYNIIKMKELNEDAVLLMHLTTRYYHDITILTRFMVERLIAARFHSLALAISKSWFTLIVKKSLKSFQVL